MNWQAVGFGLLGLTFAALTVLGHIKGKLYVAGFGVWRAKRPLIFRGMLIILLVLTVLAWIRGVLLL